jgi:hypothetical protein
VDPSPNRPWVLAALFVGVMYFVIGTVFAWPTEHVRAWRLAAWVASGVAFAAHIGYEHFRLRNVSRLLALHAALAVAIGAVCLAGAGMLQSLSAASAIWSSWLLALVVWPAVTAVPAFVAALVVAALLGRFSRRDDAG